MRFTTATVLAIAAGSAMAQRPTNTSICDYYTTALLKNNTAANQYTLLTLLVNTVVIGNYTQPNMNAVPGILAQNQTFNGTAVNLLPYFTGSLASSNRNGVATAVNFLDDGGAVPLKANKPANGTSSNQYMLLTHLYEFFGAGLGCTGYSMTGFQSYSGVPSMYEVHKFMHLDQNEVGFFIEQVGLAAQSFGVAKADITAVGTLLTSVFDVKCGPATPVIPSAGPVLQSICTADSCPSAANANCSAYGTIPSEPANATTTASGAAATASGKSGSGASERGIFSVAILAIAGAAAGAVILA